MSPTDAPEDTPQGRKKAKKTAYQKYKDFGKHPSPEVEAGLRQDVILARMAPCPHKEECLWFKEEMEKRSKPAPGAGRP